MFLVHLRRLLATHLLNEHLPLRNCEILDHGILHADHIEAQQILEVVKDNNEEHFLQKSADTCEIFK